MIDKIDFLRPRLVGDRFDGHAIPLEVLKDFSVLEDLIIEVAKWHYRKEHESRKRIPKGFKEQVSLDVVSIEEGSAIPKIVLSVATTFGMLFPNDFRDYFEMAKESIITAVDSANKGLPVTGLTDSHLAYFDRIGRSLREGESIELNYPETSKLARIDQETRKILTLSAKTAKGYTSELKVRGTIFAVDNLEQTFSLQLRDGKKIGAPMQQEHQEMIVDALRPGFSGKKYFVDGIARYDRNQKLIEFAYIKELSPIDPLDVSCRLDDFRNLQNGWYDGSKGKGFVGSDLDWLANKFDQNYPDSLPLPYLYPTGDGGVQAEWSLLGIEVSLEIDLKAKVGHFHSLNIETGQEDSGDISLADKEGWHEVAMYIKQYTEDKRFG